MRRALRAGREAQVMPTLASTEDQVAADTLSHVMSFEMEIM